MNSLNGKIDIKKSTEQAGQVQPLVIQRFWAMPHKFTFSIPPIKDLIVDEMKSNKGIWIDPFAGKHSPADIRNDLNPKMPAEYHLDALEFVKQLDDNSADGAFFDPPYSISQATVCYKHYGKKKLEINVANMGYWSSLKNEIARVVKTNGIVICCGWNSMGLGFSRGFQMYRILLVPHGGSRNDTIVTVEKKLKPEQLNLAV